MDVIGSSSTTSVVDDDEVLDDLPFTAFEDLTATLEETDDTDLEAGCVGSLESGEEGGSAKVTVFLIDE